MTDRERFEQFKEVVESFLDDKGLYREFVLTVFDSGSNPRDFELDEAVIDEVEEDMNS